MTTTARDHRHRRPASRRSKRDMAYRSGLAGVSSGSRRAAVDDQRVRVAGTRPDFRLHGRGIGFEMRDDTEFAGSAHTRPLVRAPNESPTMATARSPRPL